MDRSDQALQWWVSALAANFHTRGALETSDGRLHPSKDFRIYMYIYISEGAAVASVVSKALHAVPAQVAFVVWGLGET